MPHAHENAAHPGMRVPPHGGNHGLSISLAWVDRT